MSKVPPSGDKRYLLTARIGDREFERSTRGSHLGRTKCIVAILDRANGEIVEVRWGTSFRSLKARTKQDYGAAFECGELELVEGEVENLGVING